ncbi:MAG: phosphoribosylaminoimidazolesuccinocarboxamide synthase [Chitinispirillales bacterium]|jgi:phosphoribosylaminoimidazole-succinocarboxamide synthase|nr:phosphoribosylaminoimidazolesuccinocarboxamide synthase [Chitinispirillales bacterium]
MSDATDILYEGKSKLVCRGRGESTLLIKYKDTATAFNGEKKAELSGKGVLNAAISNLIYAYLEENGVKTHLVKVVDETSVIAKKAEIIMVEVIVRNVAAGGFSKKYGVPEGAELKNIVLEFCLKSDELGDPMINESQITAIGLATDDELGYMAGQALKINGLLRSLFEKTGIRLVDFKLEFGRCGGGIILCDEISPDSCRLWDMETDKKLDKDRFRRDLGDVLGGYRDVLARLQNVR